LAELSHTERRISRFISSAYCVAQGEVNAGLHRVANFLIDTLIEKLRL
jgi:hypothetical protein